MLWFLCLQFWLKSRLSDWMACMCAVDFGLFCVFWLLWLWAGQRLKLPGRWFSHIVCWRLVLHWCADFCLWLSCRLFHFHAFLFSIGCIFLLDLMICLVEQLCSMVDLVLLNAGSVLEILQCQMCCGYLCLEPALVIRGCHVVVPYLGLHHCLSFCCVV